MGHSAQECLYGEGDVPHPAGGGRPPQLSHSGGAGGGGHTLQTVQALLYQQKVWIQAMAMALVREASPRAD